MTTILKPEGGIKMKYQTATRIFTPTDKGTEKVLSETLSELHYDLTITIASSSKRSYATLVQKLSNITVEFSIVPTGFETYDVVIQASLTSEEGTSYVPEICEFAYNAFVDTYIKLLTA